MKIELPVYPCVKLLPGSLFGSVPTTWLPIRLKFVMPNVTVGIVITPSKYYTDDGVPAIRSLNVKDGRLADDDLVFFSEEDNWKLANTRIYKGDVVIVRTGQSGFLGVFADSLSTHCECLQPIGIKRTGGEGGIRTLGTGVSPYNGLAILSSATMPSNPSYLQSHPVTKTHLM